MISMFLLLTELCNWINCGSWKPFKPSQNGQTHLNDSLAVSRRIVWVYLAILWNWPLKGLQLPKNTNPTPVVMLHDNSTTYELAKDKVEATILDEIAAENYISFPHKTSIVTALDTVRKLVFNKLCLTHDCQMPWRMGINCIINIAKQKFQTIDDAGQKIEKGCCIKQLKLTFTKLIVLSQCKYLFICTLFIVDNH